MLDRKHVNDEIERIVHEHLPTVRTGDEMSAALAAGRMLRDLQAHSDATVEAALAEGVES